MKILMVTATYPPSANGVAVSVSNYVSEINKLGHEVWVLAPESKNEKFNDTNQVIRYPSVSNPIIEDYPIPLFPLSPKTIKLLAETKFDIVHAHHPFHISYVADLVASFNNIPLVFTYHTRYSEYAKEAFKSLPISIANKVDKYTFSAVFKKADLIIAPSKAIKDYLYSFNSQTPIEVISTGIPQFKVPLFSKERLRKKYNLPLNKKILLCVSRIGVEKNISILLKTLKLMSKEYFLVLAGTGPQLDEMKKMSKVLNISENIKFLGKIKYSDMPEIYKLADIFVFPSITETQGLVILEAEYFGLPVVAIVNEVANEWVSRDVGILCQNNAVSMKKAIVKIEDNKSRFSSNAKKFAAKFTLEISTKKLLDNYSKLIVKGKKNTGASYVVRKKITDFKEYLSNIF